MGTGWLDWKDMDLGAEFIHGSKTMLKKYVDRNVCDRHGRPKLRHDALLFFMLHPLIDNSNSVPMSTKKGFAARKMFTWAQGDGHTPKQPIGGGQY